MIRNDVPDFEERRRKLGEAEDEDEGRGTGEDELRQDVALEHKLGGVATVICVSSRAAKLKGGMRYQGL